MKQRNIILLLLLLVASGDAFRTRENQASFPRSNVHDGKRCCFPSDFLMATRVEHDERTNSWTNDNQKTHSIHLFSLPSCNLLEASQNQATSAHAALLVRRLWEWKDDVLGDGRDFFVPRPKTLMALNYLLRQQLQAEECVVLSNCARFDIFLVMPNDKEIPQKVAQALLLQYEHYRAQNRKRKIDLRSWLAGGDCPTRLALDPPSLDSLDALDVRSLADNLQSLEGPDHVARYLCRVAAGLQAQGRRPDRGVLFRPFSSRDAHVMLQLKRTADVASVKDSMERSQPRTKALFDTALQCGKAARDPAIVPAILPLRMYEDCNRRYSLGQAPPDVSQEAAKQAHSLAIEPMVKKYVERWLAFEVSDKIVRFRSAVEAEVDLTTSEQAKVIRAMMHLYMMDIREGREVDFGRLLWQIRQLKV